jgi:magnesium chelatase family protein
LLIEALDKLSLSARSAHRILKLARTIADLAGREDISSADLGEAIGYRKLDRLHGSNF